MVFNFPYAFTVRDQSVFLSGDRLSVRQDHATPVEPGLAEGEDAGDVA